MLLIQQILYLIFYGILYTFIILKIAKGYGFNNDSLRNGAVFQCKVLDKK